MISKIIFILELYKFQKCVQGVKRASFNVSQKWIEPKLFVSDNKYRQNS